MSAAVASVSAHVSPRRRWLIMALILIPVFIGALDLTIANADEFQNGAGAGIAQSRLGELDDPRVAAAAIAKARRDG